MKRRLLGFYDYTVVLTYIGMLFAFGGILEAVGEHYWNALFCLMIAGICDMFDGAVASTKARKAEEKCFGIQIDSLSDLISFGVLPGIFVYMISGKNWFAGIISGLFVLCALIRLAYFNVLEEARQRETTEKRSSYLGVPVTTIAVMLPAVYLLFDWQKWKNAVCFLILLTIMAICFVTPIEIKKPKIIGKICLILVGVLEAFAMILFLCWGAS